MVQDLFSVEVRSPGNDFYLPAGYFKCHSTPLLKFAESFLYLRLKTYDVIIAEGRRLCHFQRRQEVMKQKKTNAARRLDELKIAYRLMEYTVDEEHLDAVHVAAEVGMPAAQVFKTLVVRGDKTGVIFACIPGDGELDLKALAKASGNKRAELVPLKEVLPLTGYIRGGCSPLGAKKNYPVYMDASSNSWDEIAVSAGVRGMQIVAAPADLQQATRAVMASLTF